MFLSFLHSLSATLPPSYSLSLARVFFLLLFCISTNASLRLNSFHHNILASCLFHLSDDQPLHFSSLSVLLLFLLIVTYFCLFHLITLYIYLRLSNLLLYAPGISLNVR